MNTYDNTIAILSYAVLSEKYNNGESIILSFAPLVEDLLASISEDSVQKSFLVDLYKERYGYPMPPAILNEILNSLQRNKKIEFLKNDYIEIKRKNLEEVSLEYNATLNKLKSTFSYFAKENGIDIKPSETVSIFIDFMLSHAVDLNSFFNYLNEENEINYDHDNKNNKIIVDFLMKIRLENSKLFDLLNDIFYGMTLSSILQLDQAKIQDLEKNTGITELIVDSNYVFRLLDLQTKYENESTAYTHNLAHNAGIKFYILPETLEQIASTLDGFLDSINPHTSLALSQYGDDIFSGIHSAYIRRGLTSSKIYEIITNLQDNLKSDFHIDIWEKAKGEIIDSDNEALESMRKFKPNTEIEGLKHDLLLIKTVDISRPTYIPEMSKAKIWVLSDDNKLMRWSSSKYNKKRIPECLTESQLSTILWLKAPKQINSKALENVIFALRNQSLINKEQYKRISDAIEKQKCRFADDKRKLNAMSLLFSTKCLSLDEIEDASASEEKLNNWFDAKIEQATKIHEELCKDNDNLKDENELIKQRLIEANKKECESKSLIDEKEKEIIKLLQNNIDDLENSILKNKNQKNDYEQAKKCYINSILKKTKIFFVISAIILIILLIVINCKTALFDEHGDLISMIFTIASGVIFLVFGCSIINLIQNKNNKFAEWILKKRIQKEKAIDYDTKISQIDAEIENLETKLQSIRHQLTEKLEN